jgi:hypothetical protein
LNDANESVTAAVGVSEAVTVALMAVPSAIAADTVSEALIAIGENTPLSVTAADRVSDAVLTSVVTTTEAASVTAADRVSLAVIGVEVPPAGVEEVGIST